jgi:hypothetical protein
MDIFTFLDNPAYLSHWLVFVASLRLLAVFLGYFYPQQLHASVFPESRAWTDLSGRLFAVWTAVTCVLTLYAAVNLASLPLLHVTCLTFVIAAGFMLAECFLYRTATVATISTPLFFASENVAAFCRLRHQFHLTDWCHCVDVLEQQKQNI